MLLDLSIIYIKISKMVIPLEKLLIKYYFKYTEIYYFPHSTLVYKNLTVYSMWIL